MLFRPFVCAIALALATTACSQPAANTDSALYSLIDTVGQSELRRSPEQADMLGISEEVFGGRYAALLDDRSMATVERTRATRLDLLRQLEAVDRSTLSPDALRVLDSATFVFSASVKMDTYGYGYANLGWASPYLISQSDGAYADIIKFMTIHHPIKSRADAEAWLARLRLVDDALTDERRRFEIDIDNGAAPPRAILQRTLDKVRALRPVDPRAHPLTEYFAEALSQLSDLPEADITRLIAEAAGIVSDDIAPAYDQLITLLEKTIVTASDDPGVWRLKDGEAYYRDALRLYTTTDLTPEQIRDVGAALVEQITGEMDTVLVSMGRIEGSVGQRMQGMSVDPLYLYPDTPEGVAALLAAVAEQMKWGETKLSALISVGPKSKVEIRQVPLISQDTAPGGYYKAAAVDGSRPATYNINLRTTLDWPSWSLPTLSFHESAPGHHVQAGLARERANQPVLNYFVANPAFSEGWAVYAEDLANEQGAYENDPAGHIGYLQSILFRAARMVVDTGIHHEKWTREQAIAYMVNTTGMPRALMENEVDRYIIWPGQACAYMVGREKIRNLREDADVELGPDFDLKSFHDAVLAGGGRPLGVLETDIQQWVLSRRPVAATLPQS